MSMESRDYTGGGSRALWVIGPAVVLTGLLWVLGGGNFAIWAVLGGAAVGMLVRGVRVWLPTEDPTVMGRYWRRPQPLRYVVAAVVTVLAVLAIMAGAGEGSPDKPGTWPLAVVLWVAAAGGTILYAVKGRQAPAHEPTRREQLALENVSTAHFEQAGLTVKSPNSGLAITPDIVTRAYDDLDNPFYEVQILAGHQTPADWVKAAPRLASAWHVPAVDVDEVGVNRVRVTAQINKFIRLDPVPWRPGNISADVVTYLDRLPMGEDARGPALWCQSLREANLTVGGVPGSGKSVYLSDLLAHLSNHPHIDVGMCDLKMGVEAAPWEPRLSAVARTQDEAVDLIEWLLNECKARYDQMRAAGVRNAWKGGFLGAENHVRVLVIDEAAELFSGATREQRKTAERAAELVRSLVSLGRAAGYLVVLATQKPTADTLPSAIRDLTTIRVAFACKADAAAAAVLGSDWFGSIGDASPLTITRDERGVAVVGNDAGEFVRVQTAYISDDQIGEVVQATARWRTPWNWQPQQQQQPAPEPQAAANPTPFLDELEQPPAVERPPRDTAGITDPRTKPEPPPRGNVPPPPRPDDGWKF